MDQVLSQMRSARERAISIAARSRCNLSGRINSKCQNSGLWHAACGEASQLRGWRPIHCFQFRSGSSGTYNFGNSAPIYFGGLSGGPPIMKFSTTGAFIDGGNSLVNGTVFLGIPGQALDGPCHLHPWGQPARA